MRDDGIAEKLACSLLFSGPEFIRLIFFDSPVNKEVHHTIFNAL
jgi:hypothetical protein